MIEKNKKLISISVLSIPLSASSALVPVLSNIGKAFPNWVEYLQYLITIPPLFMMFSLLLTNKLLSKFSIKNLTLFSILIIIFSGFTPYFFNNFLYLLFTRALIGIGLGILTAIVGSLPATYFSSGQERDFATGIQSAFISGGSIIFSFLSGWLAIKNWRTVFFVQLINVIPLIICLIFMPENIEAENNFSKNKKRIFVKEALPITMLSFICIVITCTYPLNLSVFVDKNNLGDSGFVGLLASINSLIGFLIGLTFSKLIGFLKKLTLPFGLIISGIAFLIVAFSPNKWILLLGSILFGIGTSVISPALYANLYEKISINLIVPAVGMLGVGSNLSQFLSPFIINPIGNLFGEEIKIRYILAGFFTLIISILLIIFNNYKNKINSKKI